MSELSADAEQVLVTGDERAILKRHGKGIQDLVFSPNGKTLTSVNGDGMI